MLRGERSVTEGRHKKNINSGVSKLFAISDNVWHANYTIEELSLYGPLIFYRLSLARYIFLDINDHASAGYGLRG